MVSVLRIPVLLIFLVGSSGLGFCLEEGGKPAAVVGQLEARYHESARPILEKYCFRCHGPEKKKSGVRVDILDGSLEDKQLFLLKHVFKQLEEGSMPPKKASQTLRAGKREVRACNGSVRRS